MNPNAFKDFLSEILNSSDNQKNLDEVLARGLEMYKEMAAVIKDATPDERLKIQEDLKGVQEFFHQELEKVAAKMGVTRDELLTHIKNPANYAPVAWDSIKRFEGEVDKEKRALTRKVSAPASTTEEAPKKKSFRKSNKFVIPA